MLCRILTELKLLMTPVGVIVLSAGVGNDVVGECEQYVHLQLADLILLRLDSSRALCRPCQCRLRTIGALGATDMCRLHAVSCLHCSTHIRLLPTQIARTSGWAQSRCHQLYTADCARISLLHWHHWSSPYLRSVHGWTDLSTRGWFRYQSGGED